jgi:non-lysosomal glucosylceramidase
MTSNMNLNWPVLRRYDQDHLGRIALPLGGIGTGTVSLGGRGDLRDWEIVNRPAKGFAPERSFFALWAKPAGGQAVARALEGRLPDEDCEGASGATARNHGLPRFRRAEFAAAYPFGQILLSDPNVPVTARIEAFNPLTPPDAEASGIPAAILRFALRNKTSRRVTASVCGTVENFIGADGTSGQPCRNKNSRRRARGSVPLEGLFMRSDGVDPNAEQWGTMALAALGPFAKNAVSARTNWHALRWNRDLLDFWDDFAEDGRLEDRRPEPPDHPRRRAEAAATRGSLCVRVTIPPRAERSVTFLLTWHFPNRRTWTPQRPSPAPNSACGCAGEKCDPDRVGNYYATRYRDAWDVARRTAADLKRLERDTVDFVRTFLSSDLPEAVKEAALFNLSTLRTQTCFRTEDGRFYGFEGCHDRAGCCPGSCTHVWNYEQATAFLFGDLAKTMREVEFAHATRDDGHMSFRTHLPLERATDLGTAAADGQMGCVMKLFRDWRLSGDDAMLRALWPRARKALEFCWIAGGWDADRDGVMEGCQHNTMDVEYYGPNPQMQFWYLGALRAAEEMARHLGEEQFATECRDLFERGRRWTDEHLFNGEYYEHEIRPVKPDAVAPGLRHQNMGAGDTTKPIYQLGAGCLVDQLVGQFMAHVCGLGYLAKPANIRKTLRSIMKHNFKRLDGHFNNMRTYALNDEEALLMATYPRGKRPKFPFPYFNEVMTGFEYAAAVGMLYEGQTTAGLRCIEAIRARYDGRKRNPFDEAECGHHYARAMASWGAVTALTGFHYNAGAATMTFTARDGLHFWSTGQAWGTLEQKTVKKGVRVALKVHAGSVAIRRLGLSGAGALERPSARRLGAGQSIEGAV